MTESKMIKMFMLVGSVARCDTEEKTKSPGSDGWCEKKTIKYKRLAYKMCVMMVKLR